MWGILGDPNNTNEKALVCLCLETNTLSNKELPVLYPAVKTAGQIYRICLPKMI